MSVLPKPLEFPEHDAPEEEEEEESEEEWSEEDSDYLDEAQKLIDRITFHLKEALTALYDECRHRSEERIKTIGQGGIEETERVIMAEIAALACMGNIAGIQTLQSMMQDITQIEADLRCASQAEYELRFGTAQKLLTDST